MNTPDYPRNDHSSDEAATALQHYYATQHHVSVERFANLLAVADSRLGRKEVVNRTIYARSSLFETHEDTLRTSLMNDISALLQQRELPWRLTDVQVTLLEQSSTYDKVNFTFTAVATKVQ